MRAIVRSTSKQAQNSGRTVQGVEPAEGGRVARTPGVPREPVAPIDAGVVERVRARDPEALAAFFDRFFDQVFGIAYRLLGERTAAEDLTQEVFVKVHRAAHTIDPARDPTPWIVAITYNACRDLWRSRTYRMGRRTASLDNDDTGLAERLTLGANEPEQELLRGERERLVQQAITQLPEPLRVAIVLHDYQGLSHQEVAEITGVNHAAARKRYSRALTALGRILEESFR